MEDKSECKTKPSSAAVAATVVTTTKKKKKTKNVEQKGGGDGKFEVRPVEKMGRGLFATAEFKKGHVVLHEWPMVACPIVDPHLACATCLKQLSSQPAKCRNDCGAEFYCSADCQTRAWNNHHRAVCGRSLEPFRQRLRSDGCQTLECASHMCVARLAAMCLAHPQYADPDREQLQGLFPDLEDLQPRKFDDRSDEQNWAWHYAEVLVDCLVQGKENRQRALLLLNGTWYFQMLMKLDLNCLGAFATGGDDDTGVQLLGRYCNPKQSLINHDCSPNARLPRHPRDSCCALRDIAPGEQIVVSYLARSSQHEQLTEVNARQLDLAKRFGFRCACSLCKKEASSVTSKTKKALRKLMWIETVVD